MNDHRLIVYLVAGVLCAIGCRFLLHRLKIKPNQYWNILLGGGSEAGLVTVFLWPVTLAAILLWYVLKRLVGRSEAELQAEAEEKARARANPVSSLSFDDLLKKLDEETKKLSK